MNPWYTFASIFYHAISHPWIAPFLVTIYFHDNRQGQKFHGTTTATLENARFQKQEHLTLLNTIKYELPTYPSSNSHTLFQIPKQTSRPFQTHLPLYLN